MNLADRERQDRSRRIVGLQEIWHALRCNVPTGESFRTHGLQMLCNLLQSRPSEHRVLAPRLLVANKGT